MGKCRHQERTYRTRMQRRGLVGFRVAVQGHSLHDPGSERF